MAGGGTGAVELTARALRAAVACRQDLNAFSVLAPDRAMAQARRSEHRYEGLRPRPLEGVPIAVKDLIDTKAIETRYGSAAYLGHVPTGDAAIVGTLRDAGAVIVGKTTTHEFAWGVTTASPSFGDTLNPRDPSRIPGGSSGGAAAAVAYRAVAVSLGTDTGGSARIPAALCGTVGFKPSFGLMSTDGILALAPSLDTPGVIGGCVEDVCEVMRALGLGVSPTAGRLSLGVLQQIAGLPVDPSIAAHFAAAIRRLSAVHDVTELSDGGLFDDSYSSFSTIVLAEGGMTHLALNDAETISARYGPETRARIDRAQEIGLGDYASAQARRRRIAQDLTTLAAPFDYLILPTCPCTAPRIGTEEIAIGSWVGNLREALMTYTAPFNLTGRPAISIPCEPGDTLPWGLQIVGRMGQDAALLADAEQIAALLAK